MIISPLHPLSPRSSVPPVLWRCLWYINAPRAFVMMGSRIWLTSDLLRKIPLLMHVCTISIMQWHLGKTSSAWSNCVCSSSSISWWENSGDASLKSGKLKRWKILEMHLRNFYNSKVTSMASMYLTQSQKICFDHSFTNTMYNTLYLNYLKCYFYSFVTLIIDFYSFTQKLKKLTRVDVFDVRDANWSSLETCWLSFDLV